WEPQTSGTSQLLQAFYFQGDGKTGWAVGGSGTILYTTDGGKSWEPRTSGSEKWLSAVQFQNDGKTGWVVGKNGMIIHTTDGGKSWEPRISGTSQLLQAFYFQNDGKTGWAVGKSGMIIHTTDGGKSWEPRISGTKQWLFAVQFQGDGKTGWVVGESGMILHTTDGGKSWEPQISGTKVGLFSVQFQSDGKTGWVIGESGMILHTTDGGKSWKTQTSGTSQLLQAFYFQNDGKTGWVVGDGGTILVTTDAGATWSAPVKYRSMPAPWYYIFLVAISAGLFISIKKSKQPDDTVEETVADMLASDRPIVSGDPDPLNFGAIARGLSRFLRNENTKPPLTIAVTGEWGTGKSSLMNLLKADLERYGFKPVWFNAWHHQKEEQLLASLLETIKKQALPSWWTPDGWNFRIRLLFSRGSRQIIPLILLILVFSISAGFLLKNPDKQCVIAFLEKPVSEWIKLLKGFKFIHQLDTRFQFLAFLTSFFTLVAALWKGFKAFGVNPASLLSTTQGNIRVKDFASKTGFREQFAREFCDVTKALNPRTMLILIDDLDRCHPDKVLEVLEAINFLVSSGDCFVIMGMARDRVERCVGLGFKDVAEELIDDDKSRQMSPDAVDKGKRRRAEFAQQYLEKLVNIEVPLPTPLPEQSRQILVPQVSLESSSRLETFIEKFRGMLTALRPWILVAAILASGFWIGWKVHLIDEKEKPQAAATDTTTKITEQTPIVDKIPLKPAPDTQTQIQREAFFEPGQKSSAPLTIIFLPLLVLIGAAILIASRRPDVVVRDSPVFLKALSIWHPVVMAKQNTPRSVKRFLNRVRYFAMQQRSQEKEVPLLILLARKLKLINEAVSDVPIYSSSDMLPESLLVALSAIHHLDPCNSDDGEIHLTPEGPAAACVDMHNADFKDWPPTKEQIQRFNRLCAGIRVH
ncbi:MAG: hypothetical protein KJ826_17530, partial [Proteobacteria bacterium]|nr:hypothetical protein [Pseudomonadota bacterium]